MTAVPQHETVNTWKPTNSWLLGIVLAVVSFWLFAQTLLNIIPGIQGELSVEATLANLAVSITSLFSGLFVVVAGNLADRYGRVRILFTGISFGIVGALLIALTPAGVPGLTESMLLVGRAVQGLSAACIMPSAIALIKTHYQGAERQRGMSFFSIGTWGGSGACSLFGGLMAESLFGWRAIFWICVIVLVVAAILLRGTPESKAFSTEEHHGLDWTGLITFVVALLALNIYISQGPNLGWFSPASIGLILVAIVFPGWFFRAELTRKTGRPFMDLTLFKNTMFTGATASNFLINGSAGTLIVTLGVVQSAGGMSSLQSGLLTLGYLVAVVSTIRVGERLMQRFGYRKPMLWGAMIAGLGILLCSMTFLLLQEYIVVTVIGFTLFGIGLGFYATPSLDGALSKVSDTQIGSASGIYKMASSLGNAMGVAISAALYTAGQAVNPEFLTNLGVFLGRQDNVALRFGGAVGLLFNVLLIVVAILVIARTIPRADAERLARVKASEEILPKQDVAPPPIGN